MNSRWLGAIRGTPLRDRLPDKGDGSESGIPQEADDCEKLDDLDDDLSSADDRLNRMFPLDADEDEEHHEVGQVVDTFGRHLLAEIEHDLRTPLAALRMNVHLLLDKNIGDLNENQRSLAEYAQRDADRLILLMDLYIGLFNQHPAELVRKLEPVELVPLLEDAVDSVKIIAEIRQITLHLGAHDLENPLVKIDRKGLFQVLETLLILSLKISKKNREVRLEWQSGDTDNEVWLNVIIHEPAPNVEHVRSMFKLPKFASEQMEGIQFARRTMLRTCRKILLHMDGELEVCAFDEDRSGFKVKLPLA